VTFEYKPASDTQHYVPHSNNTRNTTDDDYEDNNNNNDNKNTVPYLRTLPSSLTQCSENLLSPCTN